MAWIGARMARNLHRQLLARVVNAPNNLFFDVTPIGKLRMNFMGDMQGAGTSFFEGINRILETLVDCFIKVTIIMYFSPLMLVVIVINFYFLNELYQFFTKGDHETLRHYKLSARACD